MLCEGKFILLFMQIVVVELVDHDEGVDKEIANGVGYAKQLSAEGRRGSIPLRGEGVVWVSEVEIVDVEDVVSELLPCLVLLSCEEVVWVEWRLWSCDEVVDFHHTVVGHHATDDEDFVAGLEC